MTDTNPIVRCLECHDFSRSTEEICFCGGPLEVVPSLKESAVIEAEIKLAMTALRNRMHVRDLKVFSPAGVSEYRVRFEADHGHVITSKLMPKAEVAEWLSLVN